jgi:histidinol-phosphate aminotransferase
MSTVPGRTADSAAKRWPAPRTSLQAIPAYVPGEAGAEGAGRVVKLSSNESPLGASPRARAAFERAALRLERYPDAGAAALRAALAQRHALAPEHIVCGCGSEELLHLAARAYAGPGDRVIVSRYGFIAHRIAALAAGAEVRSVEERDHHVDLEAIAAAIDAGTRLVYLANPANPTGTWIDAARVRAFHARLPPSVLLVLDAAYAEFLGGRDDYECGLSLVREGAGNVLVTRTFSKIYGLAALRIGWGGAAPAIVEALTRVRPAFNANAPAQAAAIAALTDEDFLARARAVNDRGLRELRIGLEALGIATVPSVCNFILARFPGGAPQADAAFEALRTRGVLVRPVAGYGLPDCLRITVGLPEDNRTLLDGLRELLRAG